MPKRNPHALGVPGVEPLGLSEVGVAAEVDLSEPGLAAEQDRQVELLGGPLVRGPVSRPIDEAEDLAGIGQRDDQRMITPGAVVGDIDALLAAGPGGHEGAVGIDDGLVEEVGRLLLPDLEAGPIEDVLKDLDVVGRETAAEITGGGGSGMRSAPRASRKTSSLRRSSMSSRQVPLQRAL